MGKNVPGQEMLNMGKVSKKYLLLQFITAFITCTLLGYLFHDIMNGIITGIGVGIGVIIVSAMQNS
ncbi:hypothetical protein ACSAZL_17620 [Methanosarcina sp. T3]|uniref:hypothetical protein n=1 Tax=Methanosarcina sp. T3 TaxID=3439062 RepID=UPI003F85C83E